MLFGSAVWRIDGGPGWMQMSTDIDGQQLDQIIRARARRRLPR